MNNTDTFLLFSSILVVLSAVILMPLLQLWCVYTIWDVSPRVYDSWHWLAAFCLDGGILAATTVVGYKKE